MRPFSPLFIGEVSSIVQLVYLDQPYWKPFSPLFIGEVSSILARTSAASPPITLSVPSSSGKSLQYNRDANALDGVPDFQSPLHRGSLFNCRRPSAWPDWPHLS